jgi:hypothetical protein
MVTSLSRVDQLVDPVATPQTLRGLQAHRHGTWRAARLGVVSDPRPLRWKSCHSRINLAISLLIRVLRRRVMAGRIRWDPVRHLHEKFAGSYATRVVPSGCRWLQVVPDDSWGVSVRFRTVIGSGQKCNFLEQTRVVTSLR